MFTQLDSSLHIIAIYLYYKITGVQGGRDAMPRLHCWVQVYIL